MPRLPMPLPGLVLAATVALSLPGSAQDVADMTDPERDAFRAEVRAYLLEHPEVLMEAIAVLESREAEAQAADDQALIADNADAIFRDDTSWVGGNPDGDVTVVEFLDYRCGYCRRAHPEVSELIDSDGEIRFVIKEFPILGDASLLASRFALSVKAQAGDDAYAEISDALMTMRGDVTEGALRSLADDRGLDADAVMDGMDDPEITQIIARNRALGTTLGIQGTPSFVFGDQMVRGYVPLDVMRDLVADERG